MVIAGGGTAGWMAAALLVKTLKSSVKIQLVESAEIGSVGVGEATIPPIILFNQALGLDENDFLKHTKGTFKLGIHFNHWGHLGNSYMHAFGDFGFNLGMCHFHQYWLRSRHEGNTESLWAYSLNYLAAHLARFNRLSRTADSPGINYAFHFDASLYADYLSQYAQARGVICTEGKIAEVEQGQDDFIKALVLEDGTRIEGELFIDCTGFRSLLLGKTLNVGHEDWSHYLPCDRAVAVPCASPSSPLLPYTLSTAHSAGWQWRIPLQHRLGNGHVYCSKYMSDDEATSILLNNLEGEQLAEPKLLQFTTGRRKSFWVKNCVALGLASGFLEPLESTSIHLIQTGIMRLLHYFPDKHFDAATIAEYNRQCLSEFDRIRDFLILHYRATARTDSKFWNYCREMEIPNELVHRLHLFGTTGRVYRELDELFTEMAWLQVMLGQGVYPKRYHPIADAISTEQLQKFLSDVKNIVVGVANKMPSHSKFIEEYCNAQGD